MADRQERMRVRTEDRHAANTADRPADASGNSASCRSCRHCGAVWNSDDYEFCPVCGEKCVDYCTFCGAPMSHDDMDCPDCGMPAGGVICPDCGIRNFRPFCRRCGKPLSRAARKAVEKAKQDPKVQEAARLLARVSALQAELSGLEEDAEETAPEPTEGELRLKELMAKVGFAPAEKPKPAESPSKRRREEIAQEYHRAVEEANRAMEEILPPAGMTPQEQRNYYTARKVAVMEIVEERWYGIPVQKTMGWECNQCHVLHNNPSECAVREFGGRWIVCTECEVVEEGTAGARMYINRSEHKVYKRE